MTSIPLLKLPIFAVEAVIKNLSLAEKVHFSFVSKKCHRLIKSLRMEITPVAICVSEGAFAIDILVGKVYHRVWTIWFSKILYAPVTSTIDGITIRTAFFNNIFLQSEGYVYIQKQIKAIISYLKDLFNCFIKRIYIFSDFLESSHRAASIIPNEICEELVINGDGAISYEELWSIVEGFSVTHSLRLSPPLIGPPKNNIENWSKPKSFSILNGDWVDSQIFLSLTPAYMTLFECNLSANDVKTFINRWFNSDDLRFEHLRLRWRRPRFPEGLNYESLGLTLMEYDKNRRSHAYPFSPIAAEECMDGRDFFRQDGLLATIQLDFVNASLLFCVWQERFPNLDGLRIL